MLASAGRTISAGTTVFALGALTLLAGCDRSTPRAALRGDARAAAPNESAYHPPPAVAAVDRDGGRVRLTGRAQPSAPVRLATPDGRVVTAVADRQGLWRISLAPATTMRLFSLSTIDGGRIAQAEGYLAVAPDIVAELRAGAGAAVFGDPLGRLEIAAVDFDSKGGCVVSGFAAPGRPVTIRIDATARGEVRADAKGRISVALDEPIAPGTHAIELVSGVEHAAATIDVSPAGPLPTIPLRATRAAAGWRVDWTTPGGGVQTTLLFPAPKGFS